MTAPYSIRIQIVNGDAYLIFFPFQLDRDIARHPRNNSYFSEATETWSSHIDPIGTGSYRPEDVIAPCVGDSLSRQRRPIEPDKHPTDYGFTIEIPYKRRASHFAACQVHPSRFCSGDAREPAKRICQSGDHHKRTR
jgi:hypothetical protein